MLFFFQKSGDGNGNPIHLVQSPKIPSTVKVPPLGENRLPSAMRRPRYVSETCKESG